MTTDQMISADEFCIYHKIELTFIHSLSASGVIEIVRLDEKIFLPVTQLVVLEKMVRLHYEMDINLEGLETIHHLLVKMNALHDQVTLLSNRLKAYEI